MSINWRHFSLRMMVFSCVSSLSTSLSLGEESHQSAHIEWSFKKPFGTFKREDLQRGYQVYKEVCSACHSLKRVAFRNLSALGFNEAEIKALAAMSTVQDGPDNEGKMFERPGLPKDHFPSPFPNENAARAANNGALPVDLSLVVKAREGGVNYIYHLLTGFVTPPKDVHVDKGRYYNEAFHGNQIAMPPPLHPDQVTFSDGTPATVAQMAHDVTTFLAWAAEPELESRKQLGVKVMLYLFVMTLIFARAKRRIWKNIKHPPSERIHHDPS